MQVSHHVVYEVQLLRKKQPPKLEPEGPQRESCYKTHARYLTSVLFLKPLKYLVYKCILKISEPLQRV